MLHYPYTLTDMGLLQLVVPGQVTDLCDAGTYYAVRCSGEQ